MSSRNQGCNKCFLWVKNYPTLKFMLPGATATNGVYTTAFFPLAPLKVYCCYFVCGADARSVSDS